jgi:hypothetical protein
MSFKLGKKPARHDPRTLRLAKYLRALPPPPLSIDWTLKAGPFGMMANDRLGDCTIAGAAHMVQVWTGNASSPLVIPDDQVIAAYSGACGYNPADPSTDQGGDLLTVLNYWRNSGIGGHKIFAYASVNPLNGAEVMTAIDLFGGVYSGANLPVSAQSQVGSQWTVTDGPDAAPGTWGGHCIPWVKGDTGSLSCVTWGALQAAAWPWIDRYVDELYAIITYDWIAANGASPSGFDLATLQADLAALPPPAP